jgi:F-type H+-transporting ATPase subunit alpha
MDLEKQLKELTKEIVEFKPELRIVSRGKILEVSDGVAQISGLSKAMMGEILSFPQKTLGMTLNLKKQVVGAIILGAYQHLRERDEVRTTGRILSIPASEDFISRIVDPLGRPLDGKKAPKGEKFMPLEKIAPSVVFRKPVDTPLQTGIIAIDSMIPIGRGQRELIIGDRSTGKTALAVDTIINQKGQNVVCIYVAIGQKQGKVAQVVDKLSSSGALEHTIIVAASAADPVSLQYLAPYAGCSLGEYFLEKGKDALVVFDDLTKHAWAYRQISLILRRPSGREAYPGDIFYLHSRLLERACHLDEKYGGGSLTALPIIETQTGDISSYIPTNVISITDGQIYLESDLFYAGIRPALNVGLSVSRVGGAAQIKAMKQVAGKLRLDMASYRELAAFAQFGQDLDKVTRARLDRGARITEILKQPQYQPLPVERQVATLWAVTSGFVDDIPIEKIADFKEKYLTFLKTRHPKILEEIAREKWLSNGLIKKMEKATEEFKKGASY